jgi:hypothetical protein
MAGWSSVESGWGKVLILRGVPYRRANSDDGPPGLLAALPSITNLNGHVHSCAICPRVTQLSHNFPTGCSSRRLAEMPNQRR